MKHGNDKNSKLAAYQMNIIFEEKATGFPIAFQLYFPVFIFSFAFQSRFPVSLSIYLNMKTYPNDKHIKTINIFS